MLCGTARYPVTMVCCFSATLQACLAAAMPVETNTACCFKHHTMRVQAEAEGKAFSRFDASVEYDDFTCTMSAPEASKAAQAMQTRAVALPLSLHSCLQLVCEALTASAHNWCGILGPVLVLCACCMSFPALPIVRISWHDLCNCITARPWRTALSFNQHSACWHLHWFALQPDWVCVLLFAFCHRPMLLQWSATC